MLSFESLASCSNFRHHWSHITVQNITVMKKFGVLQNHPKIWHRDMKWANAIGKMALIDLLYTVQFSCSVVSHSLRPHGPQHARLPVHHQLPEFTQTHLHWIGDAIQPSHPLSSPSPPAPNPSRHQGLFKRVSSSHQVDKVLELQLQHQSFQWTPRTDLL